MAETDLLELVRQALFAGCIVIAPVLLVGFVVGALMGLV
jgi:flagellar biosynthesis protein FliQ